MLLGARTAVQDLVLSADHSLPRADPWALLGGLTFEATSQMAEELESREGAPSTARRRERHILEWVNLAASPWWAQMARVCEAGQGGIEVPARGAPFVGKPGRNYRCESGAGGWRGTFEARVPGSCLPGTPRGVAGIRATGLRGVQGESREEPPAQQRGRGSAQDSRRGDSEGGRLGRGGSDTLRQHFPEHEYNREHLLGVSGNNISVPDTALNNIKHTPLLQNLSLSLLLSFAFIH